MLLEGPIRAAAGGRERAADALPPRARVAGRQGGPRGFGRLLRRPRLEGTGQLHAVLHFTSIRFSRCILDLSSNGEGL